jgi:hypothetical protein
MCGKMPAGVVDHLKMLLDAAVDGYQQAVCKSGQIKHSICYQTGHPSLPAHLDFF